VRASATSLRCHDSGGRFCRTFETLPRCSSGQVASRRGTQAERPVRPWFRSGLALLHRRA
jgi:hypothetical protein